MARIAFIGLGNMGLGSAHRLLSAGHELSIYNRTTVKGDSLVRAGARAAATARDACVAVDAIISMTSDDASSRSVWLGTDGILAAQPAPGTFAIECSTLSQDWVLELAATAAERSLRYIDSPVTGLPDMAAAGRLTLLVGAAARDLDACRSLLVAFCERIIHFGPVGAGTAYKLIVNLLGAVQIASAAESMAIAERAGLDLAVVADALATGQAASPQVIRNTRRIVDDDHGRDIVFTPQLRLKDVRYALQMAQKLGIGTPFGAVAAEAFARLVQISDEAINESAVIEVMRAQAPKTSG